MGGGDASSSGQRPVSGESASATESPRGDAGGSDSNWGYGLAFKTEALTGVLSGGGANINTPGGNGANAGGSRSSTGGMLGV